MEFIGGFIPASFVFGILFRPKSRRAQIEGNRNMGGLLFSDHCQQHVDKTIHGVGVLAGGGLEVFGW